MSGAMELVVLGSGSAHAQADRGQAGYAVIDGGTQVLVDFGSGTLGRCVRAGVVPAASQALLVTHVHPDHVVDLVAILFEIKHTANGRTEPLRIYGPPVFTSVFDMLMTAFGQWCVGETYDLVPVEVEAETFRVGSIEIAAVPVRHSVPAIGYRMAGSGGRVAALTGDTGWDPGLVELAKDAHLLVADCSLAEAGEASMHLDADGAARLAREARVERLVLAHLSPESAAIDVVARARRAFSGRVDRAEDLARFVV